MSGLGYPRILLPVVETHLLELDLLWERREEVVFAPDWTLAELAALEARALAHLDGLVVGQGHAADLARPCLQAEEVFAATAATLLMLALERGELAGEVLAAFETAEAPEARRGIRHGLRHSRVESVRDGLLRLAGSNDLELAAQAADVLAFHRQDGPRLGRLLPVGDPESRRLAYEAMGRMGSLTDASVLEAALADECGAARMAALRSAALSSLTGLARICRRRLETGPPCPEAMQMLGVLGEPQDRPMLEAAVRDAAHARAALGALGAMGRAESVPLLLDSMTGKESRAAADAFVRITGAPDPAGERPDPAREVAPDDLEGEFAADDAPVDPARARTWWEKNGSRLQGAERWQAGVGLSRPEEALAILDALPLQVRRDVWTWSRCAGPLEGIDLELESLAIRQQARGCSSPGGR